MIQNADPDWAQAVYRLAGTREAGRMSTENHILRGYAGFGGFQKPETRLISFIVFSYLQGSADLAGYFTGLYYFSCVHPTEIPHTASPAIPLRNRKETRQTPQTPQTVLNQ